MTKIKGYCIDCGESPKQIGDRCIECDQLYHEEIMSESDLDTSLDTLLKEQS